MAQRKKERPLLRKVMIPMITLVFLQMIIYSVLFVLNNGFSYLKRDAYKMICEKTENRKSYVENMLTQKTPLVYETAKEIQEITDEVVEKRGKSIKMLKTDPEISKQIVSSSVEKLIFLLRRNRVNDVFLILDSGELYDSGENLYRPGIYLRDIDINENNVTDNEDIFMEMGSSQIARDYGMPLDFGWSLNLDVTDQNSGKCDFYYKPLLNGEGNGQIPLYNLGYWSRFSSIVDVQQESIKYTLPLISKDGTVYGVIGIGFLKKQLRQVMPSRDFTDDSACYILGMDKSGNGIYEPILYNGEAYGRLVSKSMVLDEKRLLEYNLNDFSTQEENSRKCVGNIQRINLYSSSSPYCNERWAIVSVVDQQMALSMYYALLRTLFLSMIITMVICIMVAFVTSRKISLPVKNLVQLLDKGVDETEQISDSSSGISEIDSLAKAVVELQNGAREYALRVSRIITMSGNRIGLFLYNCASDRVFVGENIGELFHLKLKRDFQGFISEHEFWTGLIDKIDRQKKIHALKIFEAGKNDLTTNESVEIPFSFEDNTVHYFKFDLTRYHDNVFGMIQDTTQIVEEKLLIAQGKDAEYTRKLKEAYDVLRKSYASANRANQAKTDFLSHMSHDIRTPMNAIIGMTLVAQNYINDPEKIEDCLNKIMTSSEYLLSLINEVLDMSKIEAGKLVLTEEKMNLLQLTDKLLELVSPSIKGKNHTFKVHISKLEHENVIGDSVRIQQVFMNIMSNAVKYTPPGGVIEFWLQEKPVNQKQIGCYEFIFQDNGIGMSKEFLDRFFEPFEREDDIKVNEQQGTGLGMAITHNIVKMMGGDIRVESELNKGSRFTVTMYLPFLEAGEDVPEEPVPLNRISDNSEARWQDFSVLLVDDNMINREIASEILSMVGLKVDLAVNGEEALQKFEASEPGTYQMIFMDVQMPVMDGYEATRAIRALEREDAREIPIVAMTANAFAEDVRAAKESGMNEHIAKPIDMDRLRSVLDKYAT